MEFFIGAASNAIRGGQWREWFGIDESRLRWVNSDALNALIFGITVYLSSGHAYLALAAAPMMWLGAAPGWGDYIGALGGWRKTDLEEHKIIDWIIRKLPGKPNRWGQAGLAVRGMFWGACISLPFFFFNHHAALGFILAGASMPVCYWLAIKWSKHRAPGSWQSCGWGLGEIFFGAALWSAIP
jgi:hypothetical protein